MERIEEDVLNVINKATNSKYIGDFKVVKDDNDDTWSLFLYLNQEMSPMVISYQGDFDQFLGFLYEDLKKRRLQTVSYWKAVQEFPNIDNLEEELNYRDLML